MSLWKVCWSVFGIVTAIKILCIPSYRSTDFEVHRNWLAITHSLPLREWYFENTSIWTLDYPPFFAWFEKLLSIPAGLADRNMLTVTNLNYSSESTILYQRFTVILTDLLLCCALLRFCSRVGLSRPHQVISFAVGCLNPGLLMIDHVHFQYNGFLFGLLIFSLWALETDRVLLGAALFATLLNFKHLFLYMAPAFFVYIFRRYCTNWSTTLPFPLNLRIGRLTAVGIVVAAVFGISVGPFIVMGQLQQVLARMFPFQRGLVHAYWAPNFWALYLGADRLLSFGWSGARATGGTSGIVGDVSLNVLPEISPLATLNLLNAAKPMCWSLWRRPTPDRFTLATCLSALCFFLFGYHVHEKAIITITLPLSLLSVRDPHIARCSVLLSTVGHYALFPLLFGAQELLIKLLLLAVHTLGSISALRTLHNTALLRVFDVLLLMGLFPLFLFVEAIQPLLLPRLPFLPLMLTSMYCASGVIYATAQVYIRFLATK